ncbi:hypothetical protein MMC16_000144 [Acarospora aff. strigata]|nr:hypothetical protein [Acarospora aff. strigata]
MAERHRFAFAKTLFEECMDGQYSSHEPFVYNLVAAEFVKCCNSLKQYSEGEEWARRCLSSERTSHLVSRTYLKIALADSLIGQGKYVQAEPLLNDISNKTNLSDYLVTVTAIRLNRVKRRLGDKQKLRLDEGSALLKALDSLDGADQALRLEYAEEVISTISLLNQGGLTDIAEARTVIAAARGNLVNDPTLKTNWRLAVLERLDEVMSFDQKTMTGPANKGHIPYSTLEAVIQSDEEEETSDEDPYMVVDVMVEIDDNITFPPEQSITILQGEMPRRNYPTTQQRQMPRRSPISLPEQAAFPFPSTAVKIGLLTADINSTETDCMDLNDLRDTAVVQTITTTNKPLSFFSENKDSITRLEASAIKYYRSPASRSFWEERISREEWSDELYQLIRQGKPLYLIRGYLTYLGAEILERPKRGTFTSAATHTGQPTDILLGSTLDSTEEGERVIRLKGEYIAAMYVSRVMAERPPKRRAWFGSKFALDDPKLALGDSEWVTYWGIPGDELERFFPEY